MSIGAVLPEFKDAEAVRVGFAGTDVTAIFEVDEVEHRRRSLAGLGAILDRDLLHVLASLPHREAVAWEDLDPIHQALIDTAATGVVATNNLHVSRLWQPAVRLLAVMRPARDWRRDLRAVSAFAPDARRYLVISWTRDPHHRLVERARWLGVGLVVHTEHARRVVLPAEELPVVPTPRHWRLLETVYEAWQTARVGRLDDR